MKDQSYELTLKNGIIPLTKVKLNDKFINYKENRK